MGSAQAGRKGTSANTPIKAGLDVAPVRLTHVAGKDVLLVERFDRLRTSDGWQRKAMVSALTIVGLDEMMARYASYADLTEIIRHRFSQPKNTLRELFGRRVFNILCGNNRRSTLVTCMEAAPNFLLDKQTAAGIIQDMLATVRSEWKVTCDEASLSDIDQNLFWERIFPNPYIYEGSENY